MVKTGDIVRYEGEDQSIKDLLIGVNLKVIGVSGNAPLKGSEELVEIFATVTSNEGWNKYVLPEKDLRIVHAKPISECTLKEMHEYCSLFPNRAFYCEKQCPFYKFCCNYLDEDGSNPSDFDLKFLDSKD